MKHQTEVLRLLNSQLGNAHEVEDILTTAQEVKSNWVNPLEGGSQDTNGLIYGLVQSGKTGVLTVTGAVGADEGYRTIIVLTSDIDPLYVQTLGRIQEAFPGIDILGKHDIKDPASFVARVKSGTCAIVATKNSSLLRQMIENFKIGRVRGLTALIIDDEADQASLNTKARKADGTVSAINDRISELRRFFIRNTYLQVTATPQALFLQTKGHSFRPKFTVLSHPGKDYVGGDDFFGDSSKLVREFDIADITALSPGAQPSPSGAMPRSLVRALDTFLIAATFKRTQDPTQNCAFLCHVSTKTTDHKYIVDLLRRYKVSLAQSLKARDAAVTRRLEEAFKDLAATHDRIAAMDFDELVKAIGFYSPGIAVRLVNGQTDEDVAVRSPYNLFVGGNKLGRGVTIKNLLVSYYGRNPRTPQADTVLQHARMYGYRRKDIGLLRLFLPRQLHIVFRAINNMETSLRQLISSRPSEEFRGIYIEGAISATRRSVLSPGAVGIYTGGSSYNPAQVLRDDATRAVTQRVDKLLEGHHDGTHVEVPIELLKKLVLATRVDVEESEHVWDTLAVAESIGQYADLMNQKTGYLFVDRDRNLREARRETQGVVSGGEGPSVPSNLVTVFLLRTVDSGHSAAAWWPQVRFPSGRYAFAFSI